MVIGVVLLLTPRPLSPQTESVLPGRYGNGAIARFAMPVAASADIPSNFGSRTH
jgi:hypothetical protein